jgi:hypothetical protein
VLTKDCPTGLAAVRRKALVAVTMALALVLMVVGFRAKTAPGGPAAGGGGWFQRTLQARLIDARETLRQTRTLGPFIDELYPREVVAGEMAPFPP